MWERRLTPSIIWTGYSHGVFPMGSDHNDTINWYEPSIRAIFPLDDIYVPSGLPRRIRKAGWRVTYDQAFEQVMRSCRRRPGENWITEQLISAFVQIHEEGWAHSCEVWREDELVGGLYGLAVGSCFCAESMFHRQTDASKAALVAIQMKCADLGFTIFDAQIMNPHLERMGAMEISQSDYRRLLNDALERSTPWTGQRLRRDRPIS